MPRSLCRCAAASRWRRLRRLQQYARGKVISPAFADACNNLVRSLRNYRAQSVDGGLGKGGRLKVGQ
jgi:hypothetical protein